jgi:hypothetical protein
MEDQIVADIDKWAKKRLQQWVNDVLVRYDIAGIPAKTAWACTGELLIIMAAKTVAISNLSENEAGDVFGGLVTAARKDLKRMIKEKENE